MLLQGPTGKQHPVAYTHQKLFSKEILYLTVEKEAFVIKWDLDSFRYYLLLRWKFTMETDHKASQ